jgi:hypothetical protein
MRRREFLGVIGGATVLSMAAQAQQAPMPVVGSCTAEHKKDTRQ